jgi:hypothetical protein
MLLSPRRQVTYISALGSARFGFFIAAMCAIGLPIKGIASPILSNLPTSTNSVTDTVLCSGVSVFCFAQLSAAVGFSMPAGSSFLLNSFQISVAPLFTELTTVKLYDDAGGKPGSTLLTLNAPVVSTGTPLVNFIFTFTSPTFMLQPNETYWFVVENDDPNPANVTNWIGNSPSSTPTGLAGYVGFAWDFGPPPPSTPRGGPPDFPQGFAINATAVHEPSTALLFSTGLFLGYRQLRARSRKLPTVNHPA